MSEPCGQCPALRAEIARLNQVIAELQQRIEFLRQMLGVLIGGVRGLVAFLDRENTEPSMPRRQIIPAIYLRLTDLIEQTEGKRL